MVKTKQLLRSRIWFPGIDQFTEAKIKSCLACQANGLDVRKEPFIHRNSKLSPSKKNFIINGLHHVDLKPTEPRRLSRKNLVKIIRCAAVEGKPWRTELKRFLANNRATPHLSTGFAHLQTSKYFQVAHRVNTSIES